MKLNLNKQDKTRPEYTNVDGDIQCLNWLVEDNSVEEILAIDCLASVPMDKVEYAIKNWFSKLTKGGTLKLLVNDCYAVAKAFVQGQFDLLTFASMVPDGTTRKSMVDCDTLIALLQQTGLEISLKRYEGVALYVEATR